MYKGIECLLFSRGFSRICLEGISFKFFVCFIFNVSLGSAPKRKNFDIQRNTRVGSGGQFPSNRLSCRHIFVSTMLKLPTKARHLYGNYLDYVDVMMVFDILVIPNFWLVFMIFQGIFMAFHSFSLFSCPSSSIPTFQSWIIHSRFAFQRDCCIAQV